MSRSSKSGDAPDSEQATCSEPTTSEPKASTAIKGTRPPSPRNCRNFIRRETANAMRYIVDTFVEKAKEGSVPHFMSLTKVGGFDQRPVAPETPKSKRRSLARQLLDEVEKYEARQAAELEAANKAASQIGNQIDSTSPQERS